MSEHLLEPGTPVTATNTTPRGTSTDTFWKLWSRALRLGMEPPGVRTESLSVCWTSGLPRGERARGRESFGGTLEHDLPATLPAL